jgi:molybdate/tungstate transport system substrate-binding protein
MIRKLLASFVVVAGVATAAPAFAQDDTVNVLYAGSLVNLMERSVGPAFEKATGQHLRGGFEQDRERDQGQAAPRRCVH